MKTAIFWSLIFFNGLVYGQALTLDQLKQLKDQFQLDIIQLPDAQITYPVTGLTHIKIRDEYNPKNPVKYAEVELWVVDAKGKLVYNNIVTYFANPQQPLDVDYERYMMMQGKKMMMQRHNVDSYARAQQP